MTRIFASALTFSLAISLTLAPLSHAQTGDMKTNANTEPNRGVARLTPKNEARSGNSDNMSGGMGNGEQKGAQLPQFSGNLPTSIHEDRTYGVNAPGTMIGPSPENGQPDPRFPNDKSTGGGGQEINKLSTAAGSAQTETGAEKTSGAGQLPSGGTASNLNKGLPSASMDNSGANSGGASGTETNAGGDAAPGKGASQSVNGSSDIAAESRGGFPYVAGAIGFIIAMFLGTMIWAKAKRNR